MNAERNVGGPAFPSQACGDWPPEYGMSLRDWFAGQALAPIIEFGGSDVWSHERRPSIAMLAYQMADVMLLERQKP